MCEQSGEPERRIGRVLKSMELGRRRVTASVRRTEKAWLHQMTVRWNNDDLLRFFGSVPATPDEGEFAQRVFTLQYDGGRLKYELIIDTEYDIVSISGSHESPFGADSLFEIAVPCDSIATCADGYYPEQIGLNFWYGDPTQFHNRTMQLLRRPDGDLKVWPACVWPKRHKHFKMLWGENDPPLAYELTAVDRRTMR